MDKEFNELENILKEALLEQVSKKEPKYTLVETLKDRNVRELKEIGKAIEIKKYHSLKKEQLIQCIEEALLDVKVIQMIMDQTEAQLLKKLIELSKVESKKINAFEYITIELFKATGILSCYQNNGEVIVIMPIEVRKSIEKIYNKEYIEKRKKLDEAYRYMNACVNLYGIITIDEFIEIYNLQNKNKIDHNEVSKVSQMDGLSCCFKIGRSHLYEEGFFELDDDIIDEILSELKKSYRYVPSKEELLKYEDDLHFEETNLNFELKDFLMRKCHDENMVEDLYIDIMMILKTEHNPSEVLHILDDYEIGFNNEKEVQQMIGCISNLANNTRIWLRKGYKPSELFEQERIKLKENKVGRNDPCSCGSGKKYKKCCGNKLVH